MQSPCDLVGEVPRAGCPVRASPGKYGSSCKARGCFSTRGDLGLVDRMALELKGGHLQPKCTQPARRALQSDRGHPGSSYFGRTSGARPGAHQNKVVHHIFGHFGFSQLDWAIFAGAPKNYVVVVNLATYNATNQCLSFKTNLFFQVQDST